MPEVGDFEVLLTLEEQGSKIPVIILTADIQAPVREQCMQLGAKKFSEQTIQSKSDEGGVGRDFRCLRSGLQMKLTDDQLDALGELFNIGVGKGEQIT